MYIYSSTQIYIYIYACLAFYLWRFVWKSETMFLTVCDFFMKWSRMFFILSARTLTHIRIIVYAYYEKNLYTTILYMPLKLLFRKAKTWSQIVHRDVCLDFQLTLIFVCVLLFCFVFHTSLTKVFANKNTFSETI